jgi:hypothetical protein
MNSGLHDWTDLSGGANGRVVSGALPVAGLTAPSLLHRVAHLVAAPQQTGCHWTIYLSIALDTFGGHRLF